MRAADLAAETGGRVVFVVFRHRAGRVIAEDAFEDRAMAEALARFRNANDAVTWREVRAEVVA